MPIIAGCEPGAVAFYAWPDAEAEILLNQSPRWSQIMAMRTQGWDELLIHNQVAGIDQELLPRNDGFSTLPSAWIDAGNPTDHDTCLKPIGPAVSAAGGRFMFETLGPQFTLLNDSPAPPSRLTLVEWTQLSTLDAFLKSDGFKRNAHLLDQGTSSFELLAPELPGGSE